MSISHNFPAVTELVATAAPASMVDEKSLMFCMKNDMKDGRFEYPGYKVESRNVPVQHTLGFKASKDLRIGTIVQAEPESLKLVYGESENATNFRISPGDKFLVPPGEPLELTNRSTGARCILILITMYGYSNPPNKKAKLLVDAYAKKEMAAKKVEYDPDASYNGNGQFFSFDVSFVVRLLSVLTTPSTVFVQRSSRTRTRRNIYEPWSFHPRGSARKD